MSASASACGGCASGSEREHAALGLVDRRRGAISAELSGGQQQRVALARALVIEPTSPARRAALQSRCQLRVTCATRSVRSQRLSITTLFVTHNQEEALACRGRVAVLDRGQLVEVGTPQGLSDHPAHPYRRFPRRAHRDRRPRQRRRVPRAGPRLRGRAGRGDAHHPARGEASLGRREGRFGSMAAWLRHLIGDARDRRDTEAGRVRALPLAHAAAPRCRSSDQRHAGRASFIR